MRLERGEVEVVDGAQKADRVPAVGAVRARQEVEHAGGNSGGDDGRDERQARLHAVSARASMSPPSLESSDGAVAPARPSSDGLSAIPSACCHCSRAGPGSPTRQ